MALVLDRWVGAPATSTEEPAPDAVAPAAPAPAAPPRMPAPAPAAPAPVAAAGIRPPAVDRRRLALAIAFISGLTSLGYQVTWNRLLGAGTGSSTYVFTVILVLFLIGIATGAILLGFIRTHVRSIAGLIGVAQLLTAGLVTLGAAILASPSSPFLGSSTQFLDALREFARTSALVVLPPTIVMGLTFPATAALLGDETGSEGTATGALVAVNTVGAIVATFVLPFFVIPLIGSPATLAGLALINVGVGAFLLAGSSRTHAAVRTLGSVAAAGIAIAIVVSFVAGTAFRNPTTTLIVSHGGQIFEATEDEIAPVVAGKHDFPQLWVNGTSMTLITVDTKLMPILPLMLRPESQKGLVIAFGMGTAFRSSLTAGIKTDAVELVPSVPDMFKWFYADADTVLANPNGHVIVTDGRNHVELDRRDVRLRGRGPAAADRELRRVGDLVARVLPGGEGAPEPGRRDGPVGAVRPDAWTSSSPTCGRTCRCSRTCAWSRAPAGTAST